MDRNVEHACIKKHLFVSNPRSQCCLTLRHWKQQGMLQMWAGLWWQRWIRVASKQSTQPRGPGACWTPSSWCLILYQCRPRLPVHSTSRSKKLGPLKRSRRSSGTLQRHCSAKSSKVSLQSTLTTLRVIELSFGEHGRNQPRECRLQSQMSRLAFKQSWEHFNGCIQMCSTLWQCTGTVFTSLRILDVYAERCAPCLQ